MKKNLLFFAFLITSLGLFAQTVAFTNFASGLTRPVDLKHAGDDRLFVAEQYGKIVILDATGTEIGDFLDIRNLVASPEDPISGYKEELGLMGFAFHPDYATNGYFYVNYTEVASGGDPFNTIIERYTVSAADPNVADANSASLVMTIPQPYSNHNGGGMVFGPDGYLYISTGDGGSGGDPGNRAQNGQSLLGKILRIDVDGASPYAIPTFNPFVGDANFLDEIWSFGLRNPWRFSFDSKTDEMWIADVGQSDREEVNVEPAVNGGLNYGWKCWEGTEMYSSAGCGPITDYVSPVFEYSHNAAGGLSITGGYVYRGCEYPGLYGTYLFIDYSSGNFWTLTSDGSGGYVDTYQSSLETSVAGFGEDVNGELYVIKLNGIIKRVTETATGQISSPVISEMAGLLSTTASTGSYQWSLNGSPISGATSSNYTAITSGDYTLELAIGDCVYTSNSVSVTITAPDTDGDGLSDDYENMNGTDPNDPDSDDDNLTDGEEVLTYNTNPNEQDTDNDGFNDDVEITAGTDPNLNTSFPTGIKEVANSAELVISPNPVNDALQVELPQNTSINSLIVFDLTGKQLVYINTEGSSTETINVSHLANGVYFIIGEGGELYRAKFIVKH